jgi:hypothetical protein
MHIANCPFFTIRDLNFVCVYKYLNCDTCDNTIVRRKFRITVTDVCITMSQEVSFYRCIYSIVTSCSIFWFSHLTARGIPLNVLIHLMHGVSH